MPGHKRNEDLAPYLKALGAGLDITELPGFDDLHAPRGLLAEAMARAAALYGSRATFFLVNGSTGGLLAGIRAATRNHDRVLMARNCHKAVYHALELGGLEPVFLQPPVLEGLGSAASLPPALVERALEEYPDIRLVILTSPTYEGVLSDVEEICRLAHGKGVPVLVDEAHGAHLGIHPAFPRGAVSMGADLVVQSFHKTLPSLTPTGVIHLQGELISPEELLRQLGIFQTSSPSYLLMASLEGCVTLLEEQGTELFGAWSRRLEEFDRDIRSLRWIRVLGHGRDAEAPIPGVFALDPSKVVISAAGLSITGTGLMELLAEEYGLQLEMAMEGYAIAMTGMGDREELLPRLAAALLELEGRYGYPEGVVCDTAPSLPLPQRTCSPTAALERPWVLLPRQDAAGRVSAAYLWAYPPGVPLLIPGEIINHALLEALGRMEAAGVNLIASRGQPEVHLAVLT
jgi:arginine/lysine/ornithine decarboxylase